MAPGALIPDIPEPVRSSYDSFKNNNAPRDIFPDGIRTSGQHPPLYNQLRPFSDFPEEITGPTVWRKEDYANDPSTWTHRFTDDEVAELSAAADAFIASGTPLTGISQAGFPLPNLSARLSAVRDDLLNGKGFILFKGFPAGDGDGVANRAGWSPEKTAVAYMGLGTYLGYFVSQNSRGHVLGHVKDVGEDPSAIDRVRIYRTTARQFFHTDNGDLVGLLCLHRAAEGGESDLVSSQAVWNYLRRNHPDAAELLTQPIWYFDRKGETSTGEDEWIRRPVFYIEPVEGGRVYLKFDPYYVRSLKRFSDKGLVPPLSAEQERVITLLEETCQQLALHMILEVGDIQFLHNGHTLHARTAYKGESLTTDRYIKFRSLTSSP